MFLKNLFAKEPAKSNSVELLEIIEAADRGNRAAQDMVQNMGITAGQHENLRWEAYAAKANVGDPFAQYWLGFLYSTSPTRSDAECAIHWYECAANQGVIEAMRDLSFGYSEFLNTANLGYGPIPLGYDEAKEIYWLKAAAEHGDEKSIIELKERGIL